MFVGERKICGEKRAFGWLYKISDESYFDRLQTDSDIHVSQGRRWHKTHRAGYGPAEATMNNACTGLALSVDPCTKGIGALVHLHERSCLRRHRIQLAQDLNHYINYIRRKKILRPKYAAIQR